MSERVKESLHDGIMNLPFGPEMPSGNPGRMVYKFGHRDARHAAADLAAEHEAIESALVEALEQVESEIKDGDQGLFGLTHISLNGDQINAIRSAISMAYGETQ